MAIAVSHTSPDATPFCWLHGPGPCHGQVDVGLHRVLRPGRCAAHHGHRGVARRMRWSDSSDLLVITIKIDWVMLSIHRSISIHTYIYNYISQFWRLYIQFRAILRRIYEKMQGKAMGMVAGSSPPSARVQVPSICNPIRPTWNPKKNGGFERHFSMSFWVIPYWPLAFFGCSMLKFLHVGHVSPRCTPTQVYEELGKSWHDLTLSWHDGR